jgi:hypothetical protein
VRFRIVNRSRWRLRDCRPAVGDDPTLIIAATARADRSYSVARIPPGKYKLLVLDGSVSYPGAIRDQLADYADITESVEVRARR